MPPPFRPPIGLTLSRTAKAVSRAFDEALAAAGGSLPIWLILLTLKTQRPANQRELAEAVGIQGATLTHHLNAMEADGLITRRRDPANRRIHQVALTPEGESLFAALATAAQAHDRRLRAGLDEEQIAALDGLLGRLLRNVTEPADPPAAFSHPACDAADRGTAAAGPAGDERRSRSVRGRTGRVGSGE